MVYRYVNIKSLRYAKKDEEVCAVYPNPIQNVAGKKNEVKMKIAEKESKEGKCKLYVWRYCES